MWLQEQTSETSFEASVGCNWQLVTVLEGGCSMVTGVWLCYGVYSGILDMLKVQ